MAANEVSVYKSNMQAMIGNPAGMQRICLSQLEAMKNGTIDIVDPSNPFVFLLETATLLSTVAIDENAVYNRKQYPSVAVSEDDIYLHMSDVDYLDRFAKPSQASFYLLFNKDEVNAKVVQSEIANVSKLVIPRNTEFDIAGYKFTMQYPIEIRRMTHGGLQIVYDVTKTSPIQTLASNIVDWFTTRIDGIEFIVLKVPVLQFSIKEYTAPLNASAGFIKTYALEDSFYYCRAYLSNATTGKWDEIATTHSDQVFNLGKPTLLLQVFNDAIRVEMPTLYFNTGLLANKTLRIDIYTTKGPVDLILSNYISNQFTAKWIDLENDDNGVYYAPLSTFKSNGIYSTDTVVGGALPTNFVTLREQVVNNAVGAPATPITDSQLAATVNNNGFSIVKNLDNITDRQYLATRELPNITDALRGVTDISLLTNSATSPIGTAIRTLSLVIDDIKTKATILDNLDRLTILPKTLYQDTDGIVEFVADEQLAIINAMSKETMIEHINAMRYSYTPFHYVMDITDNNFDLRPYYLDQPSAVAKVFVEENDTLELQVSIGKYSIQKVTEGYRILIVTKSDTNFKTFNTNNPGSTLIQASFKPKGESSRAYLNGTVLDPITVYGTGQTVVADGELLFEFIFDATKTIIVDGQPVVSGYDIDKDHYLYFTNFQMFDDTQRDLGAALSVDIDFVILVINYVSPNMQSSNIDNMLGTWMYTGTGRGIVREQIRLRLGKSLDGLWANCRTLASNEEYQRYLVNVPKVYTENDYEIDPLTHVLKFTNVGGTLTFNKLHSIGDPYLDEFGDPIYEHLIGDVVLDGENNPVLVNQRKVARQIDLCLFDGVYYFTTESSNKSYRDQIPLIIINWLDNEIANINTRLLERTTLFFYPKTTFGVGKVVINDGTMINMYSEHSFDVRVYVPADVYSNLSIRSSIEKIIVERIGISLSKSTVALSDIYSDIKTATGELIKGIDISGFGDSKDITTFTVIDDTVRGAIRKRLQLLSESTITVQDDINITFIRHNL